jgi:TPR repeat protein
VTCDGGSCDDTPTSNSDIEFFYTKAVADIEANTDVEAAFVAMLALAKDGFASAMNDVANLYSVGFGVGLDKREALRWWRRAASKGDMCAAINLGTVYRLRLGSPRRAARRHHWTTRNYQRMSGRKRCGFLQCDTVGGRKRSIENKCVGTPIKLPAKQRLTACSTLRSQQKMSNKP